MTNTLHRQGSEEELKEDYVVFTTTAVGINKKDSAPKLQEFMRICLRHNPVNIGGGKHGSILHDRMDIQEMIATQKDGETVAAVFTDIDTLQEVISELIEADLGISINVSGLLDGVQQCCRKNGAERNSVEQSLGFWGARDRLPEREVLAFNTLCGHGLVSFTLIRKMIEYVKLRRLTPKEAAETMGRCCECAVFNTTRAEHMLESFLAA